MKPEKKNRLMREAAEVSRANCGFIHVEIVDGVPQQIISGDFHAILFGVVGVVNRIAEITHQDFIETLSAVMAAKSFGSYDNMMNEMGVDKGYKNPETIPGEDWQAEWMEQTRLEAEKAANIEVAKLKIQLAKTQKEAQSLAEQLRLVKNKAEKDRTNAAEEKRKITKECQALEARMKEMETALNGRKG